MPSATRTVRDCVPVQTYRRAEGLVADGLVRDLAATGGEEGSALRLEGTVGPGGGYAAHLELDLVRGLVAGHGCTCSARPGQGGPCKHAAALALAYDDRGHAKAAAAASGTEAASRLKEQTRELLEQYRAEAASRRREPSRANPEPPTSPQLAGLFAQAGAAGCDAGAPGGDARPVRLVPVLAPGPRGGAFEAGCPWNLKLRVARGQASYQVKSISGLLRAWEGREVASYGRNLAFRHVPAAFDERSVRLLELVARVAASQDAARAASSHTAAYAAGAPYGVNERRLPLSDRDAADVLELYVGSEVSLEPRGAASGASKLPELPVRDGDPSLGARLERGARGGWDLTLAEGLECAGDAERLFLLAPDGVWRVSPGFRDALGALCRALLPCTAPVHLREEDLPAFCATVLAPLAARGDAAQLPAGFEERLPPRPWPRFSFSLVGGLVVCDATVAYGDAAADLFSEVPLRGRPLRDAAAEARWRDLVRTWLPFVEPAGRGGRPLAWDGSPRAGRACLAADDARGLYRLLTEGLPRFMAEGEVLMSEKLRGVHARPAPRVRVEARLSSGLLDLEVVSDDVDADDLLAYLAAYEARQGYVRLASGDVARVDEEVAAALAELAAGVGRTPAELVGAPAQVPANRTLFVDALLGGTPGVAFERDEAFRELAASFDERAAAAVEPPASLAGVLRPYQLDGFCWLTRLGRLGFGGILADDMGLGKTLQLIAYLVGRREEGVAGPALVVCPASLVYNWTSEIARFAPQLDAVAVTGPRTARADAIARATRAGSVLVTSYELMKRDVDLYAETAFSCLALDEAQYIKNHATQAARCAKRVPADVRFALTGTPVENRLAELWSIFDFLMPGVLGSQEAFRHRFELPIAEGDEHAAARLQQIVAPFVLRRMKDEVLDELPEKTETLLYATLEGEQRDLYRACSDRLALELRQKLPQQFARDRVQVLAELLRLRQLCCDPHLAFDDYEGPSAKLDACLELVGNAVDSGHKVLLFSQFTSMLSRIAARLDEAGVAHFELTGATPKEERARLVEAFQAGGAPVFLISLKAGGVGLNLTAADIVVHYDPWWNLAAQNQATDRAHRIGQTNPVTVFRLIAKDTIEERIVALQEAKRDLAQSVLGGEAVGNSSLTRDDILELLGASAEIEGLGD